MYLKNKEGYLDITAAVAMERVDRKKRKERDTMGKRNCRKNTDEKKIHDKAVKMRKMTDTQLVEYVENRVEKARSEGRNEAKKGLSLKEFLSSLSVPGIIPGVGPTTVDKILKFAKEGGYFE